MYIHIHIEILLPMYIHSHVCVLCVEIYLHSHAGGSRRYACLGANETEFRMFLAHDREDLSPSEVANLEVPPTRLPRATTYIKNTSLIQHKPLLGTSPIKNNLLLWPYSKTMSRAMWWP